ncbi:hypothetical protein MTR_7g023210 [Medicago truncatula]|uniref:Uncharacterized protein n=1 Tax=Medicago truncatula TaxID=3880 RepID=A0A072TWU7_MEDTR|nr:hypothetical protein MTR_7g023210 [Medicago truncatula]
MLNGISQHCVLPRNGNFQHVSSNDLLVIYHLFMKEKLSLPRIIIHNMINVIQSRNKKSCLPYGMALTKIFIKNHIPFEGEKSVFEYSQFTPKNLSHMKQEPVYEPPSDLKRKREDGKIKNCLKTLAIMLLCQKSKLQKFFEVSLKNPQSQNPQNCLSLLKSMIILLCFNLIQWTNSLLHKLLIHLSRWIPLSLFKLISPFLQDSMNLLQWHNERPTKRSKVEKDCSKTRSDLTRVIEGNNAILHYLSWMTYEMTLSRKWKDSISDKNEFARPEQNPFLVPMYPMFMPTISSSSDASSPTIPPTAAASPFHDDKGGDDLGDYELGGPGKQLGSREE